MSTSLLTNVSDQSGLFRSPQVSAARAAREQSKQLAKAWERLLGLGGPTQYAAGTSIFLAGHEPRDIFFLAEGLVLLHCDQADGNQSVIGLRLPGQVLEQFANELKLCYPFSAQTLTPSTIYKIGVNELRSRESQNREVSSLLQHLLRTEIYNSNSLIMELKTFSVEHRLERILHLLATAMGCTLQTGSYRVAMPLSVDQLAALVGCSGRHLKRVTTELQQCGRLRLERGRVFVFTDSRFANH